MENQDLINKIKSKYIFKYIFSFIKDSNFKLKLFIHSKSYQNLFELKKISYIEAFLKKIGFNLNNYLCAKIKDIDNLNKNYQNFLLKNKLHKEEFENILNEILTNKETEDMDEASKKKDYNKLTDIDSPLFELISKTKNFEKYTIIISQENIEDIDDKLKEDFIILFNKLNKSNINYSTISYLFNDMKKLKYLKELKLDFNKIKTIILNMEKHD